MISTRVAVALITVALAVACTQAPPTDTPPPAPPPANPPPPPPPQPPPPPSPGSGNATVSLVTPNTDDGAILLELKGSSIHAVVAPDTAWRLYVDSSSSPVRALLVGNLAAGALLKFTVADTTTLSSYSATILDVSDRQSRDRADLHAYALQIGH